MTDAQRLDWLQKRGGKPWVQWRRISWRVIGSHVDIVSVEADGEDTFPTLREAIDAAAAKERTR